MENLDLNKKEGEMEQESQYVINALEVINETGIFDIKFIENIKLVSYGRNKTTLFDHGKANKVSPDAFSMQDFMYGRRTDFVGIHPRREFLALTLEFEKMSDRKIMPLLFFKGVITYDEFIAHETAHSLFDIEYKKRFGEYNERDDVADVSEEYREAVMGKIKGLCLKYFPTLEIERFSFSRQQIAEIFAQLYEREFCRKAKQNVSLHEEVFENVTTFLMNPQEALDKFNEQKGRSCTMEDFYAENHVLSMIVAPIMEKEVPDFKQRGDLFWKEPV